MPLDRLPHQTVTHFGCAQFSMYACGFSVPQMRQFFLFTYPPRSKWASSDKMIFFCQNRHLLYVDRKSTSQRCSSEYTTISVRVFCAQNATILLVYIPAKVKMSFIWKDDFFAKIGIICNSIAGPLPSVVQAYTQPYSFGGRIKLIICQIRHELNVIIHEISTSWKKTLDGGPYTKLTWYQRVMNYKYYCIEIEKLYIRDTRSPTANS